MPLTDTEREQIRLLSDLEFCVEDDTERAMAALIGKLLAEHDRLQLDAAHYNNIYDLLPDSYKIHSLAKPRRAALKREFDLADLVPGLMEALDNAIAIVCDKCDDPFYPGTNPCKDCPTGKAIQTLAEARRVMEETSDGK